MFRSEAGIALSNLLIAFYTDILCNEIKSVDLSLVHSWVVNQDTLKDSITNQSCILISVRLFVPSVMILLLSSMVFVYLFAVTQY